MQYFRFLTKIAGQTHLRALVIESASAKEAVTEAQSLVLSNERILSINVRQDDTWVVIKGAEVKGKTILLHNRSAKVESDIDPLGDAIADKRLQENVKHSAESVDDSEETVRVSTGSGTGSMVIDAAIQAVIVCVLRVFSIPITIWKGAVHRLAKAYNSGNDDGSLRTDTEFPVLEWMKSSWDGMIVLSWVLTPILFIFIANAGYRFDWGTFILGLFWTYFGVIFLSLTKEALVLVLSIALNVERLANKSEKTTK
jgi:uncharacterized membrane protein